jgi:hypothetical protein
LQVSSNTPWVEKILDRRLRLVDRSLKVCQIIQSDFKFWRPVLNNHTFFGEAHISIINKGFLVGEIEGRGPIFDRTGRYTNYIHPSNHIVLTLEESTPNEIDSCHLYGVWRLKPECDRELFLANHPLCQGTSPNNIEAVSNFDYSTIDLVQTPVISSCFFEQVWSVYEYYLTLVDFIPWETQPDLTPLLTKRTHFNTHDVQKPDQRLVYNIKKLNLNPADFGITV